MEIHLKVIRRGNEVQPYHLSSLQQLVLGDSSDQEDSLSTELQSFDECSFSALIRPINPRTYPACLVDSLSDLVKKSAKSITIGIVQD